jgi:hypothetical protein
VSWTWIFLIVGFGLLLTPVWGYAVAKAVALGWYSVKLYYDRLRGRSERRLDDECKGSGNSAKRSGSPHQR